MKLIKKSTRYERRIIDEVTFCHSEQSEESKRCFVPQHDITQHDNSLHRLKVITLMIIIICMTISCATTNTSRSNSNNDLDRIIRQASNYLNSFPLIQRGSTIVIFAANGNQPQLTNYIIRGISRNAVNDRNFSVANRDNQNLLRTEQIFQQSGLVSRETMQSITRQTGASLVVSVGVEQIGNLYELHLKVINIETGINQGEEIFRFPYSQFIRDLGSNTPQTRQRNYASRENSNIFNNIGLSVNAGIAFSDLHGSEKEDEEKKSTRLGNVMGGTYGFSVPIKFATINPQSTHPGKFSIETGVLQTQRGFDDDDSPDKLLITFNDFFLTIGNYELDQGAKLTISESRIFTSIIYGLYVGVAYSMSTDEIFKDDFSILVGTSYRIRFPNSLFYIRPGIQGNFGTQKIFHDYRSITTRLFVGLGYGV
ncbi:MAG: hypothetical protein FWG98_12105 [Candidatus Cloacimonetes bacterium]|nr:hypothetical protein [Candidatus Cloacimonadota bacterium]